MLVFLFVVPCSIVAQGINKISSCASGGDNLGDASDMYYHVIYPRADFAT